MKNGSYIKNIVLAGTLTILVLGVIVAFRFTDALPVGADTGGATSAAPVVEVAPLDGVAAPNPNLEHLTALQTQNEELRQVIETMRSREQAYQDQLATAQTVQVQNEELVQALESTQNTTQQQQTQLEAATALQAQNGELLQALETMQNREREYQTQLEAASALQAQNSELLQLLEVMQGREQEYRAQIENANQTIQQLQNALLTPNTQAASQGGGGSYEEHEEHEEHEEGHDDDD